MASKCLSLDLIVILQKFEYLTNDKSTECGGQLKLVWIPAEAGIVLVINGGKQGRDWYNSGRTKKIQK